jgi:hypothetical protein
MSMAHIVLRFGKNINNIKDNEESTTINLVDQAKVYVHGKKGTYHIFRKHDDFIVAVGYVCHINSNSSQQTLTNILDSFSESDICELKKNLVGQFVLMLKKKDILYVFSDFIGSRNVFYSLDDLIVSTSFSRLENLIPTSSDDLDIYKVFEFFSMRYVLFPTWLGRSTKHKHIKWLLPYEYLKINLTDTTLQVCPLVFSIDNSKDSSCSNLAKDLLSILKSITLRNEYIDKSVAASLTGGCDTRLVAAITAKEYSRIKYRIAVSTDNINSVKDFQVARKVAKKQGIQLDVYKFQQNRHEKRFFEITEGLTPSYNQTITPLLEDTDSYALGFGGAFGSQLFWPIQWAFIKDFIENKLEFTKKYVIVKREFGDRLYASLLEEFARIKKAFQLSEANEIDYIRLFQFFYSGRYASFIMSAYNNAGFQLEPYGTYFALQVALRVAPMLWGSHRKLKGEAHVQKTAMASLNPDIGKIIAFSSFRPLLPLSPSTTPLYLIGYAKHHVHWVRGKLLNIQQKPIKRHLFDAYHISDGWDTYFIDRLKAKYGVSLDTEMS